MIHDKGIHYPFDFFFEESLKNRYIGTENEDNELSDNESTDDNEESEDDD